RKTSGAWRSAMREIARQPKKRLTRSTITPERCWISIATGPSTRSTRIAGSVASGSAPRAHWIFIGSAWAAISGPTISAQRVTSSVDAKPSRARVFDRQRPTRSPSRRACEKGLFTETASATPRHESIRRPQEPKARGDTDARDSRPRSRGRDGEGGALVPRAFQNTPLPACAVSAQAGLPHKGRGNQSPRLSGANTLPGQARSAARLVRPPSPQAAVACRRGRARRSLPSVALRNHAAADASQRGSALLRQVPGVVAERARARSGAAR